jgi:transcriptional regulator with XRE-family HTH domain
LHAAQQLGVARATLSRLIHGQSGISADMARQLEAWLGGPKARPERRELAQDAGRLRLVAGDAAAGTEGRPGATRIVLTARVTERYANLRLLRFC